MNPRVGAALALLLSPAALAAPPVRAVAVTLVPARCDCEHKGLHGQVDVRLADGRLVRLPGVHLGMDPKLAEDGVTVGVTDGEHMVEGWKFVWNDRLRLYRIDAHGRARPLRTFDFRQDIRDWTFEDGGRRVAVYYGGLHFAGNYELLDVASGATVDTWSEWDRDTVREPDWAKPIDSMGGSGS